MIGMKRRIRDREVGSVQEMKCFNEPVCLHLPSVGFPGTGRWSEIDGVDENERVRGRGKPDLHTWHPNTTRQALELWFIKQVLFSLRATPTLPPTLFPSLNLCDSQATACHDLQGCR